MDTTTVETARRKLQAAQGELDRAILEEQKLSTFERTGTTHLLMAVHMTFGQFVDYSEEGEAVAAFSTREEAERYMETFDHPSGLAFVVREIPLYS